MKRSNRGTKSKSASSPAKASSSPDKSSLSPARALSSQAKALSSPARAASPGASVGTKLRKRPVRKSPVEEQSNNNATDDSVIADKPQDNAAESAASVAPQDDSRASSPDPNCSICLCKMEDKSFTHSCFHMFCFTCLLEWSKIKAECPLCKQSFTSIIHNIRSESDYDVYYLRDAVAPSPPAVSPDNDDVQLFPFLFGRNHLRSWTPLLSPIDLQLIAEFRSSAHGMTQGFYGADEAFHIFQHMEGRNQIYRDERWAREINLPPGLNYRTVSPEYFAASVGSEYWQLIATWLDRELATLLRHNVSMRTHVRDCVLHLLQRYDVRSVNFHAEVEPFFGSQTRLFVNQLYNFVRSPLTIRETDRQTVYSDRPPTPPESEVITVDRDDSDIEIVSSAGATAVARRRRHHNNEQWPHNILDPFIGLPPLPPRSLEIVGAGNALRMDSPIPGPSGLLPRHQPNFPDRNDFPFDDNNVTDLHEVSDSESSSASHCDNEIVVVGFDKPWRARSPISLSSDGSDVEVDEGCADTNPSSSNKSPESSEVHLPSSSHIDGLEVVVPKAPDAEGDVSSRPWSEFSPDALSEVSNIGGSFDRVLEHFLHSAGNPFAGFERRFAPEKGLDALEKGDDCSHSERRRSISEEVVVNVGESRVLVDDSFLLKRQSRKPRKRNRDDCGDSGVVVDVEQFPDSEEPPVKKAAYKKHYRGHKRSSASRPEGSLESDGANIHWEEPGIAGPGEVGATNGDGGSSTRESSESSSCATNGSRSGVSSMFHPESTSEESLHGKCTCDEHPSAAGKTDASSTSSSTCDNNVSTEDPDAKSSVDSPQRSVESAEKRLASDESTGSTTLTDSSDSLGLCDDDVHSVESIDSDDSVQWLDSERPTMTTMSVQQRKRHISIGSNESSVYSSSVSSIVLQLSDEEEEEGEKDCRRVEEVLLLPDVVGDTLRRSPQGLNLVEIGRSSVGGAASRRHSPLGLNLVGFGTGHHSLVGATSRNSPQSLNLVEVGIGRSSLGGATSRRCSPLGLNLVGFGAGQSSLGEATSRHSPLGLNLVGFEVAHSSLGGATSRHNPLGLNLVGFGAGHSSLGEATSRHSPLGLNLVGFEAGHSSLGGATSRNSPNSLGHSEDDETKINGVRHFSEFLEDISNDLNSTVNDDSVAGLSQLSGSESMMPSEPVNHVECLPGSSRNIKCSSVDAISESETVSNDAHCNEKTVNGVECLLESSENALECEHDDDGTSDAVPCDKTLVNGVIGLSDEVDHSVVQPVILGTDDSVSELLLRTSGSCPVEDALERAITELDNGCKELQSTDGPLPVDQNCCENA